MLYFGQFDITFVFLIFSKTTVSNRTGWPTAEVGHFIDIGLYPVDFFFFKKYIPELRELFQLNTRLVDEAKRRFVEIQFKVFLGMKPNHQMFPKKSFLTWDHHRLPNSGIALACPAHDKLSSP